jgi:hypothetical protein
MTSSDNPENTVHTSFVTSIMTDRDTSAHLATTESATEPLKKQARGEPLAGLDERPARTVSADKAPGESPLSVSCASRNVFPLLRSPLRLPGGGWPPAALTLTLGEPAHSSCRAGPARRRGSQRGRNQYRRVRPAVPPVTEGAPPLRRTRGTGAFARRPESNWPLSHVSQTACIVARGCRRECRRSWRGRAGWHWPARAWSRGPSRASRATQRNPRSASLTIRCCHM